MYDLQTYIRTFLAAYRECAHTSRKVYQEGGGHGCNFQDGDFGFYANFIICAQVTYSGSYLCAYQVSFRTVLKVSDHQF